jgi:HEAT repeat protein
MGALIRGAAEVQAMRPALMLALSDKSPSVQIAAGEALGKHGNAEDLAPVLSTLIKLANPAENGAYVSMQALNAIDSLGPKAAPLKRQLTALPNTDPKAPARVSTEYIKRLREDVIAKL